MYSYGPPHMAEQNQDDQLEHTYSSYVRIRDVALKTCQRRWTIGRSDERLSEISVLAARHDDDDDDHPKIKKTKSTLRQIICTHSYGFKYLYLIIQITWRHIVQNTGTSFYSSSPRDQCFLLLDPGYVADIQVGKAYVREVLDRLCSLHL